MIRIGYMSDLHLEYEHNREWFGAADFQRLKAAREALPGHPQIGPLLAELDVDLMVIAGDVWLGTRGIGYCADVSRFLGVPVVTVAGNHEFYGHSIDALRMELAAEAMVAGVHFLDNSRVDLEIGGQRLAMLGTTLWTRRATPTDHNQIYMGSRPLVPSDTEALHHEAVAWLETNIPLAKQEVDAVVVVTHHAPIREAIIDSQRRAIAYAYAEPLGEMITALHPDAWIFGHTHVERLYPKIGGVPVVTAARGYVCRDLGWRFIPQVLEIGR